MATTKYPVPIVDGNSKEMIVKNKGVMYEGEADAFLVFGPGTWDSSFSSAKVSRIADAPFTQGERIIANATVTDPAEYTATFDLMFPPEIVISLELADLNLTAISTAPGESTFASISGFYETDLLDDGFLWSFRWEASSSDPDKSVFTFNSNPLLGLDDDALSDQFLSMVSSASGVHALLGSFLVEVSIFPTLSPGQDTLDFIFGGTNEYFAEARTVPEPSTLSLIASAAIMITCGYACARARKHPS
jgi:hypothetical protein